MARLLERLGIAASSSATTGAVTSRIAGRTCDRRVMDSRVRWWLTRAGGIVAWVVVVYSGMGFARVDEDDPANQAPPCGIPTFIATSARSRSCSLPFTSPRFGSTRSYDSARNSCSCRSRPAFHRTQSVRHLRHVPPRRDPDHVVGDAQASPEVVAPSARVEHPDVRHGHCARDPRRHRPDQPRGCNGACS